MRKTAILTMFALGTLLASSPSYAYLDPDNGSMLVQSLLAAIVVASAGVAAFWGHIRAFLSRFTRKSADRTDAPTDDNDTYALANQKHENLLIGAYADGWAGPTLNLQVAPAASAQTLEIEFFAPGGWLPQPKLTVQASCGGKPEGASFEVVRGANALWLLPLESAGGCYEVRIAPTFVPARSGYGIDRRELSVMLRKCGIVRADGEYIGLFPEKVPA